MVAIWNARMFIIYPLICFDQKSFMRTAQGDWSGGFIWMNWSWGKTELRDTGYSGHNN